MGREVTHVQFGDLDRLLRPFEQREILQVELVTFVGVLVASATHRQRFATDGGPFDPERQRLSDTVSSVVADMGVVANPTVRLDRRFEQLQWALDELGLPGELVRSAVYGSTELIAVDSESGQSQRLIGVQGLAVRSSRPESCRAVADLLSRVRPDALYDAIDLERMEDEEVYKASRFDGNSRRQLLVGDFINLGVFYNEVAAAGHSVLVITD